MLNPFEFNFSQKRALVTGGTRGIGHEIALNLHKRGCQVTVTGTKEAPEKLHENFTYQSLDLSNTRSVRTFLDTLNAKNPFDILVNNAGINIIEPLENLSLAHWNKVLQVNLTGSMILTQAISKDMPMHGRIVNISSIFGVVSRVSRHAYSASKAGLIGFTRSSALDLAAKQILVNAICPGFTDTALTARSLSKSEKDILEGKIPLGRMAQPKEIANVVLFFCSHLNSFTTGQTILVDGGFTAQ